MEMWYGIYSILSATIIVKPFISFTFAFHLCMLQYNGSIGIEYLVTFSRTKIAWQLYLYSGSRAKNVIHQRQFYASASNARSTNAKRRVIGNKNGGCLTPFHCMFYVPQSRDYNNAKTTFRINCERDWVGYHIYT